MSNVYLKFEGDARIHDVRVYKDSIAIGLDNMTLESWKEHIIAVYGENVVFELKDRSNEYAIEHAYYASRLHPEYGYNQYLGMHTDYESKYCHTTMAFLHLPVEH